MSTYCVGDSGKKGGFVMKLTVEDYVAIELYEMHLKPSYKHHIIWRKYVLGILLGVVVLVVSSSSEFAPILAGLVVWGIFQLYHTLEMRRVRDVVSEREFVLEDKEVEVVPDFIRVSGELESVTVHFKEVVNTALRSKLIVLYLENNEPVYIMRRMLSNEQEDILLAAVGL